MIDDGKGEEIIVEIKDTGEKYRVKRTSWEMKFRNMFNALFALNGMIWSRVIDEVGYEKARKMNDEIWGMIGAGAAKEMGADKLAGRGTPRHFFEFGQTAVELLGLWAMGVDLEVLTANEKKVHNVIRKCPIIEAWRSVGIPKEKWPVLCTLTAAWDEMFARTLNPKMRVRGCCDPENVQHGLAAGKDKCNVIIELTE